MEEKSTEERILLAAEQEFFIKGLAGARMQEIADRANINKALLHYYYRSKEKLFLVVFKQAVKILFPKFFSVLDSDIPLFEKIELFVKNYIQVMSSHTHLPPFVLYELNHHPSKIIEIFPDIDFKKIKFYTQVKEAVERKEIIEISPEQLFINILSMCVFPFVAKPIFEGILFKNSELSLDQEMQKRGKLVAEFVIKAIKIESTSHKNE